MTEQSDDDDIAPARFVEYYASLVELDAAIVLRGAAGWELLSAGHVDDRKLWAEYERAFPAVPDDAFG